MQYLEENQIKLSPNGCSHGVATGCDFKRGEVPGPYSLTWQPLPIKVGQTKYTINSNFTFKLDI